MCDFDLIFNLFSFKLGFFILYICTDSACAINSTMSTLLSVVTKLNCSAVLLVSVKLLLTLMPHLTQGG